MYCIEYNSKIYRRFLWNKQVKKIAKFLKSNVVFDIFQENCGVSLLLLLLATTIREGSTKFTLDY